MQPPLLANSLYFISVSLFSVSRFFFLSVSGKNRIHFRAQPPSFCSKSDESPFLQLIIFFLLFYLPIKKNSCPLPFKKNAGGNIFLLCLRSGEIGRNGLSGSSLEREFMAGGEHMVVGLANRWKLTLKWI